MTKNKFKDILRSKKGYYNNGKLKKGIKWLSNKFGVSEDLIRQSLTELKEENNEIPDKLVKVIRENNGNFKHKPKSLRPTTSNNLSITKPGTYWVTGCVHAPFHNKAMYESTFDFLDKEIDLNGVILDGDILDMHSISRHNKGNLNPNGITLDWEYKEGSKFIDEVDDLVHSKSDSPIKHYLYGNHEMWHSIALKNVDTAKYGEALLSPLEGLGMLDRDYIVQTDYKTAHINFGNFLEINHGEFVNVHSAKKTIDTYRKSVLYFHTHRFQIYMEGLVGGFNMGWGGDQNAPVFNYATRAMKNSWVNASSLVTLDKEGRFHVQPLLFLNNKLIVNGKEY